MSTHLPPQTDKQIAAEALGRMPENATLAEISERFAILANLARGQRDARKGRKVAAGAATRSAPIFVGGRAVERVGACGQLVVFGVAEGPDVADLVALARAQGCHAAARS